jgi:hypothetical protein
MPGGGVSVEGGVNRVSFTLPSLPGSVNTIYGPRRTMYSQNGWGLKDEWVIWSTKMIPYILPLPHKVAKNSIIRVDRCYYYQWFTNEGNWKIVDTANMDRLLFNIIAKKIGIDDLFFKQGYMDSLDSSKNQVEVVLTEITEAQWRAAQ